MLGTIKSKCKCLQTFQNRVASSLRGINPVKHKHDNNFVGIRDKEMSRYKKGYV